MKATLTLIPVDSFEKQFARSLTVPTMSELGHDLEQWSKAFLAPNGQGNPRELSIEGGWGARRLALVLDVSEERYGRVFTTRAFGYTGEMHQKDFTVIDPEARVHFNRLITTVEAKVLTPLGEQSLSNVLSDYHLLPAQGYDLFTLRPYDLLSRAGVLGMNRHFLGGDEIFDMRSRFTTSNKGSLVSDEYPVKYIDRLFRAIKWAYNEQIGEGLDTDVGRIINDASMRLHDRIDQCSAFMSTLVEKSNYNHDGSVSYGELLTLFMPDVTTVLAPHGNKPLASTGISGSLEEFIAARMRTAVSGLMGTHGVSMVYLEGDVATGDIIFGDKRSFADSPVADMDDDDNLTDPPNFVYEVNRALKAIADANGVDSLMVSVDINLVTVSKIYLSLNGAETVLFVSPMYASAVLSNLTTDTERDLDDLARFVEELASRIVSTI